MKRKDIILEKLEEIDNHMISANQAMQTPTVTREVIERYLQQIKNKLYEITSYIKLED